jgi:Flp pilus assembly protein TadD
VAKAALDSGAPDLALRVADLELAKKPNDVSALIARGDALYALGQSGEARRAYAAATKLDPEVPAAQVGLGRTLAQSDPGAAEAAFLRALSHDPDNVIALNNLGVVRDLQGHHAEAQEAYSHAMAIAPTSVDVQINLGMSLALAGRTSEASSLLRGIAAEPEARQAWRKELINALTLAGDGAWVRQELPIDPTRLPQAGAAVADQTDPAVKETPPSVMAESRPGSPGTRRPANVLPATRNSDYESEARGAPPSDHDQTLAIATSPRAPVRASSLRPVVVKGGDHSLDQPIGSSPELAQRMPDATNPGAASVEAIAKPLYRLDRYATAIVPRSEDVAGSHSDASETDFYVQLASLTSEAGAFFEWERLRRHLPQYLGERDPTVTRAEAHGRTYWRLRTFGFTNSLEAKQMCRQLEEASLRCWAGRGI